MSSYTPVLKEPIKYSPNSKQTPPDVKIINLNKSNEEPQNESNEELLMDDSRSYKLDSYLERDINGSNK